jgi:phage-related protein
MVYMAVAGQRVVVVRLFTRKTQKTPDAGDVIVRGRAKVLER